MASLGRLTIDMVANIGGFERDMGRADRVTRQAMRRVSRELNRAERDAERAARSIRNLGLQLGALSAVAVAGVTRELRAMTQQADRLDKLATATGVTVEELQRLGFAAEQSGSDMETVGRAVTQLQRNIQGATDGLSSYNRAFDRIGVSVRDLQGLSPDQQFLRIAQALSEVGDAGVRNATALEIFGRAGRELIPLLDRGADGIRELGDQFERTGAVISTEAARDFARFNDELNLLRQQAQALRVSILSDLIGPLADFVQFLNTERGTAALREALDALRRAAIAVGGILAGRFLIQLGAASAAFVRATAQVAALTFAKQRMAGASVAAATAVTGLRFAVSALLGPVGIAIAVVGSLVPAFLNLRQEYAATAIEADNLREANRLLFQSAEEASVTNIERAMQATRDGIDSITQSITENDRQMRIMEETFSNAYMGRRDAIPQQLINRYVELEEANARMAEEVQGLESDLDNLDGALVSAKERLERLRSENGRTGRSFREISQDAERFRRRIEDLADRLDGDAAVAARRFTRAMAEANQMLMAGKISAGEHAQAVFALTREFNRANQTELPTFVEWLDQLTNQLTAGRRQIDEYGQAFRRLAGAMIEAATGMRIFGDSQQQAAIETAMGPNLAQSLSFAISASQGRNLGDSIGNALRTHGMSSIQEGLQDALGKAFKNLDFDSEDFAVGALALGEIIAGRVGAGIGTVAGALVGGLVGAPLVGAAIGNLIGGLFEREKDPKFQLGGTAGFASTGGTARGGFGSLLGETLFRFRNIEDSTARQLQDALVSFDQNMARAIRDPAQLQAINEALRQFAFDSQDQGATLQDVIEARFELILGTFDDTIQSVVREGFGIEEQAQRLADILAIQRAIDDGLGFTDFDRTIELIQGLGFAGESLGETFNRLSEAFNEYGGIVARLEEEIQLTNLTDFQRSLITIRRQLDRNIDALNRSARATGLQAAREEDLARAHEAAAIAAARAIQQLEQASRRLVEQIFDSELDIINQQIAEMQATFSGGTTALGGFISEMQRLIDFADSLLIGNLSPLGSRDRLQEGLSQLQAASAAGDAARVQQLAQQVLGIGRDRFASGSQFSDLFDQVQAIIRGTTPRDQTQAVSIVSSPALEALFAERDRLEAEAREQERRALSLDLAQNLADIAGATGDSFAEVAERLGFPLEQLADVLGLEGEALDEFLRGLQVDTDTLAESLDAIGGEIIEILANLPRDFAEEFANLQSDPPTPGGNVPRPLGEDIGDTIVPAITDTTAAVSDLANNAVPLLAVAGNNSTAMLQVLRDLLNEVRDSDSGRGRSNRTREILGA